MEEKETTGMKNENKYFTHSKIDVKPFYTPDDLRNFDYEQDIGDPGKAPFARGIYPKMYRKQQ